MTPESPRVVKMMKAFVDIDRHLLVIQWQIPSHIPPWAVPCSQFCRPPSISPGSGPCCCISAKASGTSKPITMRSLLPRYIHVNVIWELVDLINGWHCVPNVAMGCLVWSLVPSFVVFFPSSFTHFSLSVSVCCATRSRITAIVIPLTAMWPLKIVALSDSALRESALRDRDVATSSVAKRERLREL